MKRVVDTSAWIEWLIGSPLGQEIGKDLPQPADWLVPTIVQLELARWAAREGHTGQAEQIIALAAAALRGEHGLATADAIISAIGRSGHRVRYGTVYCPRMNGMNTDVACRGRLSGPSQRRI